MSLKARGYPPEDYHIESLDQTTDAADQDRFPDELVFAFVYAVGTHVEPIQAHLTDDLSRFGYKCELVKISDLFEGQVDLCKGLELLPEPYFDRIRTRMDVGNRLREVTDHDDIGARLAITLINQTRPAVGSRARPRTAYIVSSLRREEEVALLREVYGSGFFLIAVYAPEQERLLRLRTQKAMPEGEARKLIERDKNEKSVPHGQRTSDAYALADVFVPQDPNVYKERLSRFVDLAFGCPFETPTQDEHGMFLAYSASVRSGDLSRQVGAALTTSSGDVLAVGCNDVPRYGGGLYWPGVGDQRDHVRGSDSNEKRRDEIIRELLDKLVNADPLNDAGLRSLVGSIFGSQPEIAESIFSNLEILKSLAVHLKNPEPMALQYAKELLQDTALFNLTEFGRTVHAEMDALFTCARTGRSPVGATLFSTTFPCHNCTRHIVTGGVRRVVYIEPYPKSLAFHLHYDSIVLNEQGLDRSLGSECQEKVVFEPFLGVGPRRFLDLFSLKLSTGRTVRRKEHRKDGEIVRWQRLGQRPRVPLDPTSYLDRENIVAVDLEKTLDRADSHRLESRPEHEPDTATANQADHPAPGPRAAEGTR
jgi:deoxycytidylate deaminase